MLLRMEPAQLRMLAAITGYDVDDKPRRGGGHGSDRMSMGGGNRLSRCVCACFVGAVEARLSAVHFVRKHRELTGTLHPITHEHVCSNTHW